MPSTLHGAHSRYSKKHSNNLKKGPHRSGMGLALNFLKYFCNE